MDRFLNPALSALRWIIIGTMLLVTLAWPLPARTGDPVWPFVLAFAGYNALIEVVRKAAPRMRTFAWVPFADLPMAALLYALDLEPGGPLFVSFYLAVFIAAAVWTVWPSLLYTAVTCATIVAIAPTLPLWESSAGAFRELAVRLLVLCFVSGGTALLSRRLAAAYETSQTMQDRATRLETLDQLHAEFVSNVSHDLRTPLTAARAALGLFSRSAATRLQVEERALLENTSRNIERLSMLIDDLIAWNQIELGTLQLHRAPFDLRTAIQAATTSVSPLFRERTQHLNVDLPEPLPILGDARQLENVIVNLLANAQRYTPDNGTVAISGRVIDGSVALRVHDTGPGIPEEELTTVFERFHRVASVGPGSGLGLAIAKSMVKLHEGRIWAESAPGTGATFHIRLPIHRPEKSE